MTLRNTAEALNFTAAATGEQRGFRRMVRAIVGGALASGLAALAVATPASASTTFNFTGTAQTYVVPVSGTYSLLAQGAAGGSWRSALEINPGGLGAMVGGQFNLTAGDTLTIIVGGVGGEAVASSHGSGGGGGTFIFGTGLSPLLIAGGGGGAGNEPLGYAFNGGYANPLNLGYGGGVGGAGGHVQSSKTGNPGGGGGGGGGLFSAGETGITSDGGNNLGGGGGAAAGGAGGLGAVQSGPFRAGNGGFGGGGGGGVNLGSGGAGGGGGGYTGGRGGYIYVSDIYGLGSTGLGGFSYVDDAVQADTLIARSGGNPGNSAQLDTRGHGTFILSLISASAVPEPSSWALMILGMAGIGAQLRRRRPQLV